MYDKPNTYIVRNWAILHPKGYTTQHQTKLAKKTAICITNKKLFANYQTVMIS